jgi:spermidine synthase
VIPWRQLGTSPIPGEKLPMVLYQRDVEFVIRVGAIALMSSAAHGSEEDLAEFACSRIAGRVGARVLVGGLGMGFTLAAALRSLAADARVEVVELVPAVVEWNRGPLAHLAGRPLEDARVTVWEGDVVERIRGAREAFDAIVLDVDNGPDAFTVAGNDRLYSPAGLRASLAALRDGGVLGVWSVAPDREFTRRLSQAGFASEAQLVRARRGKGGRHTLWLATRGGRRRWVEL